MDYSKILTLSERHPLSHGLYGQTYLVENGQYVIKQQRCLDDSTSFQKELDIFHWIEKLPISQRIIFCRLLSYRFIQPCDLPRRETRYLNGSRLNQIRMLNDAPKCVEMLLENKGIPLDSWLEKNMPRTPQQVYYLMRHLTFLHLILFTGGYLHNDLHFENVLVGETHQKLKPITFTWNHKRYSFKVHRNQVLTAIDYGEASRIHHKQQHRLLDDVLESIADLLLKRYAYNNKSDIAGARHSLQTHTVIVFPPRVIRGVRKVIESYPDVFEQARVNAIELNGEYKAIFESIEKKKNFLQSHADELIRKAIRHIQHELQLTHPDVFSKLFDGTTFYKRTLLPKPIIRGIMACRSIEQLLDLLF